MPRSKEFLTSSESESEEPKQKKKKQEKKEKPASKPEKPASKPSGSSDGGENMFQLSKMKFATVSEFKGKKMVNIREYYESDGELKPGRKGIALMMDQWKKLKDHIEDIDEAIDNL